MYALARNNVRMLDLHHLRLPGACIVEQLGRFERLGFVDLSWADMTRTVLFKDYGNVYRWQCSQNSCWDHHVNTFGFLQKIYIAKWLAFFHFIVMLRSGNRWHQIVLELESAYNVTWKTLIVWRRLYQYSTNPSWKCME